jgi:hypothetical protein
MDDDGHELLDNATLDRAFRDKHRKPSILQRTRQLAQVFKLETRIRNLDDSNGIEVRSRDRCPIVGQRGESHHVSIGVDQTARAAKNPGQVCSLVAIPATLRT